MIRNHEAFATEHVLSYPPPLGVFKDIQLLRLHSKAQGLKYKLLDVPCDSTSSVPYEAILHWWDNSNRTRTVGEALLSVIHAVYGILCDLPPNSRTLHIWIDTICIDQKNKAERAKHSPLMNTIYPSAIQVLT